MNIITTTTITTNFCGPTAHSEPGPPHYRGFTITLRHTTVGRTPLDEWLAGLRGLYLTTHNTHNRHASMPPARFEPAIRASEGPQTHTLDRTASGDRLLLLLIAIIIIIIITIHGQHHPKADVDRLYVPRKQGGRGLMQLEAAHAVEI